MADFLLRHEVLIRLGAFCGILVLMGVWELLAPQRRLTGQKPVRWGNNLGIVFLNSAVLRWVFPVLAVGLATLGEAKGWGLLNWVDWPVWLEAIVALLVLDAAIYLQHVMMHAVPSLWRLHRMHHSDVDLDVTTGARFHPLEIVLSMGIKLALVLALGPAPVVVVLFEVLLNGTAMFNHANIHLPPAVDRVLRWFVVTPAMHRVHHSVIRQETDSNFGFNLPWWDRMMGTYRAQPAAGHEGMTIGLLRFRESRFAWLPWLLLQPLLGSPHDEESAIKE